MSRFGGALQTGAQNMDMMLAGRFFAGFGVGILADLAPLYQAEIAHPSMRGSLTTLQQFMLGIGGMFFLKTQACIIGLTTFNVSFRRILDCEYTGNPC